MCDRCETKGLLEGLFAKAGVMPDAPALPGLSTLSTLPARAEMDKPEPRKQPAPRRLKLWELEEKHHCPVIGSCLTLDDLKKIARKGGFSGTSFEPYRLHVEAVSLSCSRNDAAEAMHKRLESKFALILARFDAVKTDAEVLALWKQHLERGEVAGAMWAALTHKAAGRDTRNTVYGDVHMLSHQVGAGQAADLRRLEWLERQRGELLAENARLKNEQLRLADQAEQSRRELTAKLAAELAQSAHLAPLLERVRELESGQAMVAIGRQLLLAQAQAARAREAEARIQSLEEKLGTLRADKARLTRERDEAGAERDALEHIWTTEAPAAEACGGDCGACPNSLRGRCVLCVGGRTPLLPQYRQLAERLGVRLIHHDGGREEALARLPELLKASDAVICPTDCVGHLAYYQLKKHCKQSGKPCVLTRNSGVAGFAVALTRLAEGRADIQSQV